jgi:hypothetical protein
VIGCLPGKFGCPFTIDPPEVSQWINTAIPHNVCTSRKMNYSINALECTAPVSLAVYFPDHKGTTMELNLLIISG